MKCPICDKETTETIKCSACGVEGCVEECMTGHTDGKKHPGEFCWDCCDLDQCPECKEWVDSLGSCERCGEELCDDCMGSESTAYGEYICFDCHDEYQGNHTAFMSNDTFTSHERKKRHS